MSRLRLINAGNRASNARGLIDSYQRRVNRRRLLQSFIASPVIFYTSSAQSKVNPGRQFGISPDEDVNDAGPKFLKKSNGIRIQELEAGSGEVAQTGDVVVVDYVLRRSNGYFIYSTVEGVSFQPRDVPIGPITFKTDDQDFIAGFRECLIGMKIGGRRRVLIPSELAYQDNPMREPQPPNYAGKRQILSHANEPFLFEIELLKIRTKASRT